MNELWDIICCSNMSIQNFAETVNISLYRIAEVLYGQSILTTEEKRKIQNAFNKDFLPTTKHNV